MNRFIALCLCFISTIACATPPDKLVVLGDSLSDNGNAYEFLQHQYPPSPPYYKGRFSNGPVWAEYLAEAWYPGEGASHLEDYAIGGAAVSDESSEALFTLKQEVANYLKDHQDRANPKNLYVIWIGANNYFVPLSPHVVQDVIHGIERETTLLIEHGARKIMFINLPDMSLTPWGLSVSPDEQALLHKRTEFHNRQLGGLLLDMKARFPNVKFLHFNMDKSFEEVRKNAAKYHMTNFTEPCLISIMPVEQSLRSSYEMVSSALPANDVYQCPGYFFFDKVHATTATHALIADAINTYLRVATRSI